LHKTLRNASLTHLVDALKKIGYVSYKPPYSYKRGKFHVEIKVHSQTRCTLTLHRDRLRYIFGGHEAVWYGEDITEEMNKIMAHYGLLKRFQLPSSVS